MTVLDLIKRSMRLLSAINIGDNPTADEAADGLMALNAMTDAWATERLMLYTTARTSYASIPGQQIYNIGPAGADWIGARPAYLDGAGIMLAGSDPTQAVERPITIFTDEEWQNVAVKSITSTLPTGLHYEMDYPNGAIALWPVPTISSLIVLYMPVVITQWTAQNTPISFPPGYARALPYNLALELAPEFNKEPPAVVVAIAQQSKLDIKRMNFDINKLRASSFGVKRGGWDYISGEIR